MYFYAALIAASTLVSSCKPDEPVTPGDTPAEIKCYVTKEKVTDPDNIVTSSAYIYNSSNKVDKVNTFGNDGTTIENYSQFTYDANGNATQIDEYEGTERTGYTTIEYNSSKLPIKARIYDKDTLGNLVEVAQLTNTYNASGQATRSDIYFVDNNGDPVPFLYVENTYANGNIVSDKTYIVGASGSELNSTTDYTYDSKNNPYLVLNQPILMGNAGMSKNNVVKAIYKDENGMQSGTDTYVYEYTARNYPSKAVLTSEDGGRTTTTTTELEYLCK